MNTAHEIMASLRNDVDPGGPIDQYGGFSGLDTVLNWMGWIGGAVAVFGLLLIAGQIFLNTRRNDAGQVSSELTAVAVGALLIGSASTIASFIGSRTGKGETVGFSLIRELLQWVSWVVVALAFIGILVTAGRMVLNNRRGEGLEDALNLGWIIVGLLIVASAGSIIGLLIGWA